MDGDEAGGVIHDGFAVATKALAAAHSIAWSKTLLCVTKEPTETVADSRDVRPQPVCDHGQGCSGSASFRLRNVDRHLPTTSFGPISHHHPCCYIFKN